GSEDPAVFNAVAKIYIDIDSDSDSNPEQFLKENNLYEPLVVGKFCEPRDPYLAYIAYAKRSHELVVITNDNSMFKQQARYFVKHCEPDLWTQVLAHDIHLQLGSAGNNANPPGKAGITQVWKQGHAACIEKSDFRLAQICGLHIIVHTELSALIQLYERQGHFEEIISLLEAGLSLERAHMGIFTELSILLSEYQPAKRFDLLRSNVVEELSWQHGLNDFYMPYRIQVQRSLVDKLAQLEEEVKERSKKEAQKERLSSLDMFINLLPSSYLYASYVSSFRLSDISLMLYPKECTNNPDPGTTCTAKLFETLPDGRSQPLKTFIYLTFEDCGLVICSRLMSSKANLYARSKYAEAQEEDAQ
ncbi:hypothetical protein GALMADRAFT_141595, partial [Galerina marginata CBS 339.88]